VLARRQLSLLLTCHVFGENALLFHFNSHRNFHNFQKNRFYKQVIKKTLV
jgi:hypothetical protein